MRRPAAWLVIGAVVAGSCVAGYTAPQPAAPEAKTGSVIFYHVDGTGIAHWQMARMVLAGPDGDINWDRLPHTAVYRGHAEDVLTPSSNAGATMHAYGVKAPHRAFGMDAEGQPPLAPSGQRRSIMQEAQARGIAVGLVNSGSATEPGTAVFVTSVAGRDAGEEIVAQLVASGAEVLFGGGEKWFLPAGLEGRHGKGERQDGRNLVQEAEAAGYRVVYTRDEMFALPAGAGKVLGIFAWEDTFNDEAEEVLAEKGLEPYDAAAPTLAEMTEVALRLLGGRQFLLVVEEEGTDNFGNCNNATGTLEALRRADEGLGVALDYVEKHPDTLLLTCADSEAGAPDVVGLRGASYEKPLLEDGKDSNGAPVDGAERTPKGGVAKPFVSAPDRAGKAHEFVLVWATRMDASGGVVARAAGLNADQVRGSFDNTAVYPLFYQTLFGAAPAKE